MPGSQAKQANLTRYIVYACTLVVPATNELIQWWRLCGQRARTMMRFIAHWRPVVHVHAFNGNADVGHFFSQSTLPTEPSSRASILSLRATLFIHDRGLAWRADNPRFLLWDPFKTATENSLRAGSDYQDVIQHGFL
jgi:hypothetical protein